MADESFADDGGIYAFWAFVARKRIRRNLEDVAQLLQTIEEFNAEQAQP